MKEAVVFDLDGTLCDDRPRLNDLNSTLDSDKWDKYHRMCESDIPFPAIQKMIRHHITQGREIFIVTARPEAYKDITKAWLEKFGIKYYDLVMKPYEDRGPSWLYKISAINRIEAQGFKVVGAYDDSELVLIEYEREGILAVKCKDGAIVEIYNEDYSGANPNYLETSAAVIGAIAFCELSAWVFGVINVVNPSLLMLTFILVPFIFLMGRIHRRNTSDFI